MAKNRMFNVAPTPSKKVPDRVPVKTLIASNKRARHDYAIDDVLEAGVVLTGTEVKALRAGRASLIDAYVAVDRGEAWLEAAHIAEYAQGTWTNHAPRRKRKLLLHRFEIDRLDQRIREKGYTIVPLSLYFLDGRVKVEIGVGRGKKEWDKRQALRERQDNLEAQRSMRYRELG
ncbi:SsrA-binding protein [Rarobacter incanus]|uniref:SsrA-binding protein n=2 Tax=Rarobacter incanus TaxID=153494 RepID=A0A542SRR5_9MICO|nr:SsrA-binding protein [Rarobacter incanus]